MAKREKVMLGLLAVVMVLGIIDFVVIRTKANTTEEAFLSSSRYFSSSSPYLETQGLPTVVEFSANWCPACQYMSPVIDDLEKENLGVVNFIRIDYDTNELQVRLWNVKKIPTIIFLDDTGREVYRLVGAYRLKDLEQVLDDLFPYED